MPNDGKGLTVENIGEDDDEVAISNGRISAIFDVKTSLPSAVKLHDGRRIPIEQNFHIYTAAISESKRNEHASGAYIFNPNYDELLHSKLVLRWSKVNWLRKYIRRLIAGLVKLFESTSIQITLNLIGL